MANEKQHPVDQDRDRIDVSEEHECRFWTEKFGVTYQQLKKVVAEVGPLVKDVRERMTKTL